MKRLVLIDGHAILHRAYFAFPKTLRTRDGEVVNAVYGFTRMVLGVIEDLKPEYLAVAFDLPKPTFRHKEYIGYQAQRPKMEAELADQINRVYQVVSALNIPIFEKAGFEADDVIGTLATQATKRGVESVIVTGDRDIMQLVNRSVKVYAPQKGFAEGKLFGSRAVQQLLGVKPRQIVDYKALVGDTSDNYPGVPGIGPKTAVELFDQYDNFDTIIKNIKKLRPVVAQKLRAGRDSAKLSKKLAKIVTNVPVKLDLKACRVRDYDRDQAIALFGKLEFKSLIRRLPSVESNRATKQQSDKEKNQQMKLI